MDTEERQPIYISVTVERVADPLLYDWLCQFSGRARTEQLGNLAHDGALMRSKWLQGGERSVETTDEEAGQLARRQAVIAMFGDSIEDD